MTEKTYCGYIAILGRPNVGKSTLLNQILGEKVSITSRKPQTTRHKILGIHTQNNIQAIFVDTPGLHLDTKFKINQAMVHAAKSTIADVDMIIFMCDVRKWTKEDDYVLSLIANTKLPVFVLANKIDRISDKNSLLPVLTQLEAHLQSKGLNNAHIIPISAKSGSNVEELTRVLYERLPESPHYFPSDMLSDKGTRFMIAELIREKLMRYLGQELPHKLAVELESFKTIKGIAHIHAIIWVERSGQKKIVIGEGGERLKQIGSLARKDIEKLLDKKVFLQLWVKVKSGWTNDERALRSLGYHNED